jgi:exodeoxyribonuclease V alpha subunit
MPIQLDTEQQEAVDISLNTAISIITGGAGSGKSTVIKTICDRLDFKGERYLLCAPTGKAAKRIQEVVGRPAKTIHRMLGATFGSWKYNSQNKLRGYSVVVCDEASMIDIDLLWRYLQAFPISTRLVFVGDANQLQPVGPGSVFRDMIEYKCIPVVKLQNNHRQGKGSTIAANAKVINLGGFSLDIDEDFEIIDCPSHIHLREELPLILNKLKAAGYDLIKDVQVLAPQKSTQVGVEALNEYMRFLINPNARRWDKFSVGDKVMQNTNDYQLNIFNGYCGVIRAEYRDQFMIEFFDMDEGKLTEYPKDKIDSLIPAYCCTVHKFQGSEIKAGIAIISSSHTFMLTRNLLYTAVTRFKEKCIILGDKIALKRAITNTREGERYSKLLERLRD